MALLIIVVVHRRQKTSKCLMACGVVASLQEGVFTFGVVFLGVSAQQGSSVYCGVLGVPELAVAVLGVRMVKPGLKIGYFNLDVGHPTSQSLGHVNNQTGVVVLLESKDLARLCHILPLLVHEVKALLDVNRATFEVTKCLDRLVEAAHRLHTFIDSIRLVASPLDAASESVNGVIL
jgi:hypothetical protein